MEVNPDRIHFEHPNDSDNTVTIAWGKDSWGEDGLFVTVSEEHAMDSYNETFTCAIQLTAERGRMIRDFLMKVFPNDSASPPSPVGAEIEAGRLRCEIRKALGLPSMESYSSGGSMVPISAEQSAKMRADADEHKISASPVGGETWRTIGDTLEWLRNYLENLDDYPEPREAIERVEAAISALKRQSGEG